MLPVQSIPSRPQNWCRSCAFKKSVAYSPSSFCRVLFGLKFVLKKQVLKFLPLMIGWFSLSVPSALGLYWILNNFISTGTSVFIRNKVSAACVAGANAATRGGRGWSMY